MTFSVPRREKEAIKELMDDKVELLVEKYKEKRSRNANSYMWVLCSKIADAIGISNTDVYKDAIKHCGVFKDFELDEDKAKTLQAAWERLGVGWLTESDVLPNGVLVRCYYGSSSYNTKQMSRLVDYVINEAHNLDIETLTENEILNLKNLWEANNA